MKDSWERSSQKLNINDESIRTMINQVFKNRQLVKIERTETGLSSGIYKVQVEGIASPFILRISNGDVEVASKEKAIVDRLSGIVPVADYVYFDTTRNIVDYDWSLLEWKEGVLLRDILQKGDERQIIQAAEAVGSVLARIHSHTFDCSGSLAGDLSIVDPFTMGTDEFNSFISESIEEGAAGRWLGTEMTDKVRAFCLQHSSLLSKVDEPSVLVHSDFNGLNILMLDHANPIKVSAVLDWEFAFAGRRYVDIGNMLRYENRNSLFECHFIQSYRDSGGYLNENWRLISILEDIIALLDILNHSTSDMPNKISDVRRLITGMVQ